jgi:hypothetical protein
MNQELKQRAIIHKMQSCLPYEDKARQLDLFYDTCADWYGTCQRCMRVLRGSRAELKAHVCGSES